VVVNNDVQQRLKKGKVIMTESERLEVVRAIRWVDEALIAIDDDPSIVRTLERVAETHPGDQLFFANGGDRKSAADVLETAVCEKYGIEMRFGVGGDDKVNSSSSINQRRGEE
jgi:glycerol-3-phosphate cytidylyltransferase-like family protein